MTEKENLFLLETFISDLFAPQDEALVHTLTNTERNNMPKMHVSASQGKLLYILAKLINAKKILELGTYRGYSGIHLARALPEDGKLITIELDKLHVTAAIDNFNFAGLSKKVEVINGNAIDILKELNLLNSNLFDLIFIDARNNDYPKYLDLSVPLLRKGGLLLADNTLCNFSENSSEGIKLFNQNLAKNSELESIMIPMIKNSTLDGLSISIKK
jgi:predicted O-methyltransferase YrrM